MSAVSVLGLGAMGSRMAARIAEAGHDVTVWNRTAETATTVAAEIGATTAPTPAEAVASADVVISMLADDAASHAVWLGEGGALAALPESAVAVEASTITQTMAIELGAAMGGAERRLLEAPVVGSRPQADADALFSLVGGDADALDAARGVIEAYSGGVRHVGGVGNAAACKLAINGLFGVQVAAYAESVGMLARTGMSVADACDLLGGLPITAPGLQRILGLFAEQNFAPNFPVRLVSKDLGYLGQLADSVDSAMPVASTAAEVFATGASAESISELDIAGIAALYLEDVASG